MDFSLSPDERKLRATTRAFIDSEIIPLEPEVLSREASGEVGLPRVQLRQLQHKAKDSGIWGIATPREFGGMGLGAIMQSVIYTELGRTFVPFDFGGKADNILFSGTPTQREKYLLPTIAGEKLSCFAITEPEAGSDATAIQTTARKDGDEWVVNGSKKFIGNGHDADFVILFASTDPEKKSRGGITCFLIDRELGWSSEPVPTMGERRLGALHFDNVRVPEENVLGEVGYGFALAMKWISHGRVLIPSRAVGAGERLLGMAVERARTRHTFGQSIGSYQGIQWLLADSAVELEQARWTTLYAAWREEHCLDSRAASSIAKLSGTTMANAVVDRVMQVHGALGYTKELPIERWYRELRHTRIFEGTDEIMRRTIAKELLSGKVIPGDLDWDDAKTAGQEA